MYETTRWLDQYKFTLRRHHSELRAIIAATEATVQWNNDKQVERARRHARKEAKRKVGSAADQTLLGGARADDGQATLELRRPQADPEERVSARGGPRNRDCLDLQPNRELQSTDGRRKQSTTATRRKTVHGHGAGTPSITAYFKPSSDGGGSRLRPQAGTQEDVVGDGGSGRATAARPRRFVARIPDSDSEAEVK